MMWKQETEGFGYYRLNPELRGPADLDISSTEELNKLIQLTVKYLEQPEIKSQLDTLCEQLKHSGSFLTCANPLVK